MAAKAAMTSERDGVVVGCVFMSVLANCRATGKTKPAVAAAGLRKFLVILIAKSTGASDALGRVNRPYGCRPARRLRRGMQIQHGFIREHCGGYFENCARVSM